jgi:RNA polymerase sigma-70 factor (ECF subfamily)
MTESPSDEALMLRMAQGDARALRPLVDRHLPRALAVATRVLGNRSEAEDAVQEAFTGLWTQAARWQAGRAAVSTWLYRVVVNACTDLLRRRREHVGSEALQDLPDAAQPTPDQELAESRAATRVRAAVMSLPLEQRTAVALCYFEGFSNTQAAEIMGLRLKALEGLLVRARRRLRDQLDTPNQQGEPDA